MKHLSYVLLSVILTSVGYGQCDFFDDYSTNTGWTQVGTEVEVSGGKLQFINGAKDGNGQKRVYKNLGTTLTANDVWYAEFDFYVDSVGRHLGQPWVGHIPFALTAGTQDPYNNCPDVPCTGLPTGTQDVISFNFLGPSTANGDLWMRIKSKDGSSEFYTNNIVLTNVEGMTYYPRIERLSATSVRLSVFTDSSRTIHVSGSPVTGTIPNTIDNLFVIQHSCVVQGNSDRELTGTVDNLCINFHGVGIDELNYDEKILVYPNPFTNVINISNEIQVDEIQIIDVLGKVIYSEQVKKNQIDVTSLARGIYFIKLISQEKSTTIKIIKR